MQIEQRIVGNVAIVKVTGDITLNRGGDVLLKDKVLSLIQQGYKNLLIDLSGVSYVDSAGLGELVQAYATTKSRGVTEYVKSPLGPVVSLKTFESDPTSRRAIVG